MRLRKLPGAGPGPRGRSVVGGPGGGRSRAGPAVLLGVPSRLLAPRRGPPTRNFACVGWRVSASPRGFVCEILP